MRMETCNGGFHKDDSFCVNSGFSSLPWVLLVATLENAFHVHGEF
jgi:hypothetical protein